MQAEPIAFENEASFYVKAKDALDGQELNQELEDELDRLMRLEHERDEEGAWRQDNEIEAVMFPEDPGPLKNLKTDVYPSEFTEFALRIPTKGDLAPFSFEGREYLRTIYDSSARRTLLKFSRQSEKCESEDERVVTPYGQWVTIRDVEVGDEIVSLKALSPEEEEYGVSPGERRRFQTSWKFCRDKVVDKLCVGELETVRLTTRMGAELVVSAATPILLPSGWKAADELEVGDRVAAARTLGTAAQFGQGAHGEEMLELLGIFLADGSLGSGSVSITKFDAEEFDYIVQLLRRVGNSFKAYPRSENKKPYIRVHKGPLTTLLDQNRLRVTSARKFIPDWVFQDATREETIAFLRGLWRCDGSVTHPKEAIWNIVYASTNKQLAQQVRWLLLKLGIPSRMRANNHLAYKDNPDRDQYLVRVETIEGVRGFLETVGYGAPRDLPEFGNSNRDTYPIELVGPLIEAVYEKLGLGRWKGYGKKKAIWDARLPITLKYPLSRAKLQRYVNLFYDLGVTDIEEYAQLRRILHGDVVWDKVVKVEYLGSRKVYHIEIEENHNYLHDGLVTHNSTLLGNKALAYSGIIPNFKSLYVSATATQATVFSVDRLKEPIDISPELSYLLDSRLSQNVLFKQFKNRSQIRIRYAFLHADRVRGIPSDYIMIDEIQDIIYKNVPVIEQCASHSDWKLFNYSGTPKSLDNTIEVYWAEHSTQNEWVVPCERHGTPKRPDTWFWNILGASNIGKHGPVCAKCKQPIDPAHPHAQWVSLQPVTEENAERVAFEGYHVSQLMVPWVVGDKIAWYESILFPYETYDKAQFNNEVLGLSFDSGQRPLTKNQVKACCQDSIRMHSEGLLQEYARRCHGGVAAGLDHGSGEKESYSVLTLGGYMGGEFQIFFAHRFVGEDLDPRLQLLKIAKILQEVDFVMLGSDYGGGFDRNDWLMRNFGPHKVAKYQYASGPKRKVKWEPELGRFILHRTEIMSDMFNAIRNRKIWLPNYNDFRTPYAGDMLNIFSEYNSQIHMTQYKVSPGKSDDTFHSALYCFLASMFIRPRPDILIPLRPNDIDFTPDMHS